MKLLVVLTALFAALLAGSASIAFYRRFANERRLQRGFLSATLFVELLALALTLIAFACENANILPYRDMGVVLRLKWVLFLALTLALPALHVANGAFLLFSRRRWTLQTPEPFIFLELLALWYVGLMVFGLVGFPTV